jgi:SpoIID/LytB domain protein
MKKFVKSGVAAALATILIGGSIGAARGATAVPVPAGFTITGSGFGHGIGLSQYGAQGMGLDGFTAAQILTHYYPGTTVDPVVLPNTSIRVGILQDQVFVAVRGEKIPGKTTGGGFSVAIDALAPVAIQPGVVATFTTVNGRTSVTSNGAVLGAGAKVTLTWAKTDTVIHVKSGSDAASAISKLGSASCVSNSCSNRYRYGTLEISSGTFDTTDKVVDLVVVNTLRLSDEYLYGLGEVPSSWTESAMQAQAIAARSYAVKKTSTRSGCACQIYSTTLDQAFVGYSKEIGTSGNRWVAAVDATIVDPSTAYVVRFKGSIISTYYSSSTGGKSQPSSEVWGSTLPYLVSVDDHWSQDPRANNSNSAWTDTVDQASLIARLRAQGILMADVWSMTVTGNYPSGGISKLNLADSAGNITELRIAPGQPITPDELRGVLGTKSTYISKITAGIETVDGSTSATAKKLTSVTKVNWPKDIIAPNEFKFTGKIYPAQVGSTIKLQKRVGGKWKTVSSATTNIKGSWSVVWSGPSVGSHDLRIAATNSKGTITTSTNRIKVAGAIAISAPKTAKRSSTFVISGTVSPGFEGVAVIVEKKIGNGSWTKIATVKTDAAGKWVLTRSTGVNSLIVSYRSKTSDSRLGVLVSSSKTTKVK